MTFTKILKLLKPAQTDTYNIDDQNTNMDLIDAGKANVKSFTVPIIRGTSFYRLFSAISNTSGEEGLTQELTVYIGTTIAGVGYIMDTVRVPSFININKNGISLEGVSANIDRARKRSYCYEAGGFFCIKIEDKLTGDLNQNIFVAVVGSEAKLPVITPITVATSCVVSGIETGSIIDMYNVNGNVRSSNWLSRQMLPTGKHFSSDVTAIFKAIYGADFGGLISDGNNELGKSYLWTDGKLYYCNVANTDVVLNEKFTDFTNYGSRLVVVSDTNGNIYEISQKDGTFTCYGKKYANSLRFILPVQLQVASNILKYVAVTHCVVGVTNANSDSFSTDVSEAGTMKYIDFKQSDGGSGSVNFNVIIKGTFK